MSQELLKGLQETLGMILGAGLFTLLLGFPLGSYLALGQAHSPRIHAGINTLTQAMVSVPYLMLMILVAPLTRLITGSTVGCWAATLPLTLACVPLFAQATQKAFDTLPPGLIDMARSLGANPSQIIFKVLIPEALPQLIRGFTLTLVHLAGYTAISGALGSGGLGSIAIHQGYFSLQTDYLILSALLLFLVIQLIQNTGDYLAERKNKRLR